jgi:hypothetical protein
MNELVKSGFRPLNLPPKSSTEKERHQAHVTLILASSASSSDASRDVENKALDSLWRTALLTKPELVLTDQMKRLWTQYGLPSRFVRSIMWPFICPSDALPKTDKADRRLIELDIVRMANFLEQSKQDLCIQILSLFEYTQGMSYICVRLMAEFEFNCTKTIRCMNRILYGSPTTACMYSLDRQRIKLSVEFVLEAIAWDNIPQIWYRMKMMGFDVLNFFFLEWSLTLFTKNFSSKISGFVLDMLFISGDVAIYKATITVLRILDKALAEESDLEGLREILSRADSYVSTTDQFITVYHEVEVNSTVMSLLSEPAFFQSSS